MFEVIKDVLTEEELALLSNRLVDMLKNRKEMNTDSWPDIVVEKKVVEDFKTSVQAKVKISFLIYDKPGTEKGRVHVSLEGFTKGFRFPNFTPFNPTLKGKEIQNLRKALMETFLYTANLQKAEHRKQLARYSWIIENARFF
jgi:hypothetical protein